MKRPTPAQLPPAPLLGAMYCPECGTQLIRDPGSCYYCPGDDDGECAGFDTYDLEDEELDELN